jgi:hypothetical protein
MAMMAEIAVPHTFCRALARHITIAPEDYRPAATAAPAGHFRRRGET